MTRQNRSRCQPTRKPRAMMIETLMQRMLLASDLQAVRVWCVDKQLPEEAAQVAEIEVTVTSGAAAPPPRLAQLPVSEQLPLEQH